MSLVEPTEPVRSDELGRVHFVGIGGVGMSGIARILLQGGASVSGSDAKDGDLVRELGERGATVHVGHDAQHVDGADTVVVSSAVREDNPELREARRRGLRVLPRAAALGALLRGRNSVAVTGTHGKTTITAMLTTVLRSAGADPGYVIGGTLASTGAGADAGAGEIMVAEADESDGSFLMLWPDIAVVSNVEADHLDNYGDLGEIHANFAGFVDQVRRTLVIGIDDPGAGRIAELARERGARVRTYGEDPAADYRVSDVRAEGFTTTFTLHTASAPPLEYTVPVPGRHNALNAAAAVAVAEELGYSPESASAGLRGFSGAARRFEYKGEARGVALYDSYAHHPTEIAADLRAARSALESHTSVPAGEGLRPGRVIAVFQPHLYSRTRIFAADLADSLSLADVVLVLPIYAAREDPEPGVSSELITRGIGHGRVRDCRSGDEALQQVAELASAGDLVFTMGAGDVTELGPELLAELERVSA
ncbi:UDP-N-acetylmuramate--L-alanine ligase [Haloactinospora alba]|uniref:UDP-N-acetylmuramate--L-alanine ligase n=1 Tax=Haloactinospora alba TaxID=405555 RepID=A0A543NJE0_9ACTN|nr:UDP-N-acetylmuramate--L-alanine ligase [Haloactinospora alba]TQN31983.1 UDP-N-acetylmuramate--L-alanine ligase [Haloactinospora alba]